MVVPPSSLRVLLVVAVQYFASGCSDVADQCQMHSECASGLCRADGTCGPAGLDGGALIDGGGVDAESGVAGCMPDHDGTISRAELPLAPGRVATYRVALDAEVSTAGTQMESGKRLWDLSGELPGDEDTGAELVSPEDQWWAELFPNADYATSLSAEAEMLGVFELTDTRLRLLGVVSPQAGTGRTELTYDPPVDVLVLPLTPSSSWTSSATVSGLAQGFASYYTEDYQSSVDALGTLVTPYGEFPVSRVATDLTRQVGAVITTRRTFAFMSECYSQVGMIASQDYEDGAEFSDAAEVRRLAP